MTFSPVAMSSMNIVNTEGKNILNEMHEILLKMGFSTKHIQKAIAAEGTVQKQFQYIKLK